MAQKLSIKMNVSSSKEDGKLIQIGKDISIRQEQHDALLKHCIERLDWAKGIRDKRILRFEAIDKEVAGFQILSEEDKKRKDDMLKGFGPKPFDVNLPMTKTQLDEAITFLMTVFFPEEGAYQAVAPEDEQAVAKGLSTLMNKHASDFGHYLNVSKFLYDGLKYNLGLAATEWRIVYGSQITNNTAKIAEIQTEKVVNSGNEIYYLDPYNTFLDPSVPPVEIAERGEFFGYVEAISTFRAKRMKMNGEIFNVDHLSFDATDQIEMEYYKPKPDIAGDAVTHGAQAINWDVWLSPEGTHGSTTIGAYEFLHLYIHIPEKEYGLSTDEQYGIWRLTIVNGDKIVDAVKQTNAHGKLPCNAVRPWDDNFDDQTQSFAEMLLPFQRFSSFQMNVHQHAARKALYGILIYNKRMFPELQNADVDLTSCKIGFDSAQELEDIRKHFLQLNDTPDTQNTLRDITDMDALMQKVLPTELLKQVTDLQRATKYQAAAAVQGANRRNLKIANICEAQAFYKQRAMQMYNILQFQEEIDIFSPEGELIKISPSEFRDTKLEFVIGAGLRGLDKLTLIETMKEILNAVLQSQHASANIDVVALINYITTLIGDYTDFTQFRFENEFDKLPPEQKQQAFALLQQAMTAQQDAKQNGGTNDQ